MKTIIEYTKNFEIEIEFACMSSKVLNVLSVIVKPLKFIRDHIHV